MSYDPGESVRFHAVYYTIDSEETDPSKPYVTVYNPDDEEELHKGTPVKDKIGEYHFDYDIPSEAESGSWTVEWGGTVKTLKVKNRKDFAVYKEEL